MAYDVPKFLKRDGESLKFNNPTGEFVFYVPEVYFERGNAEIMGDLVRLLGILDYTIFDDKGKNNGLNPFRFPTIFLTKPSSIEKIKGLKLTKSSEIQDYRLLKYKKDDTIVVSVKTPQEVENAEELFKILLCGKLPTTIRYDTMHDLFPENLALNGGSYNISMQMFGVLVSEFCRNKNDLSKPFRLGKITDMTDYASISVKDIPKYVSPFAAITSENWDEAVVAAIETKDKYDKSPMSKVLMG